MSRAQQVMASFYEDAGLRGSLTDDEAEVLLRWAAAQAERIDVGGADDAAFEALAGRLHQLVERINWTAGEGIYSTPEARANALNAIAADAQAVGLTFVPSFSAQAAPADPMEALQGLLASLEAEPAPAPDPAAAPGIAAEAAPLLPAPDSATGETDEPTILPTDDEDFYDL
jgi:hypothetical protein